MNLKIIEMVTKMYIKGLASITPTPVTQSVTNTSPFHRLIEMVELQ